MIPKVSVIVPIYGVEQYIERCAISLFEQTLEEIEFIFVNDCTQDRSITILANTLSKYPNRKDSVRIINHEVNKGLAAARKTGVDAASGEYIAHCDSDDWLQKDIYQIMYDEATRFDSDIVICDYYLTDGKFFRKHTGCLSTDKATLLTDMVNGDASWAVWNKLVKKGIYRENNILYPDYAMGEDMVLMIQLIWYSNSISYVPLPLYNYYINQNSITLRKTLDSVYAKYSQLMSNISKLSIFFTSTGDSKLIEFVDKLNCYAGTLLLPYLNKKMIWNEWVKHYSQFRVFDIINVGRITFKQKIATILIAFLRTPISLIYKVI